MAGLRIFDEKESSDLGLSKTSTYAIGFLINAKQNKAADPIPFKVSESALEKIAKTAINKPWIPGKKGDNQLHLRKEGVADQTDVIDFHRKHAGGNIVDYYFNPNTKNVSVIVEIFPEFIDMIKNGEIDEYLSPMLGNIKVDTTTGEIIDAEIVHIHSVESPGYERTVAKFNGTCDGPIKKCVQELQVVAAAGKLQEYRNSSQTCPIQFLNKKTDVSSAGMSAQESPLQSQQPTTPSQPDSDPSSQILAGVDELKTTLAAVGDEIKKIEAVEDANAEVLREVAAAAGIDDSKVMTVASMGEMAPQNNPAPTEAPTENTNKPNSFGAAGEKKSLESERITKLEKQLEDQKNKQLEKEKRDAEKQRVQLATIIAKGEIKLREGGLDQKNLKDRVKHYVELKDTETKELIDLKLTATKYQQVLEAITPPPQQQQSSAVEEPLTISAAGIIMDDYPVSEEAEPDYNALEDSI